ncbi:MAG: 50S ribosomal protein L3 [Candidatus Thermofonsia Clade 1 bacterium]|jgi:large subunit ribosomal protein L3|uniref:Large ribosomal subunit protein uL3 n=1 Tax=Candidatus Thermofonsia Clade 1 bacterium TaxID=2364210 RepID=A0A2M8PIW2_9CHLR|nr:MAG: 50S ribosomal protein L3 [Candidatus Thermofonsia Clade 1 bacterium]PJF42623.1 MAG: 50S ribosomal protein L3 [Candidatus Thermofonsia Clade 1 bacterium]RMF51632.1 MAG: 50S ribosomal protein L3 [Chloroflexota bacterium]
MKGIIGRKLGMTQLIAPDGKVTPVTVIQAGPCFVTMIRTPDRDGYTAVQVGFEEVAPEKLTGGERGHLLKRNLPTLRYLREFRVREVDVQEGQRLTVEMFDAGDRVDVVGTSKGRGFAGTIKRHGFHRQATTHGASDRTRAPGGSSSGTTPGRVKKGTRRAGRMGNERVTTQNLEVMAVDAERNLLAVKGSVPGAAGGLVIIKESVKARKR